MTKKVKQLTPKQSNFLASYTNPTSATFGNAYKSAREAGFSDLTSRNLTHVNPKWLSESFGNVRKIEPEEITQMLTTVIYDLSEPTIVRLKATEMMMRYYSMLKQTDSFKNETAGLFLDLSTDSPTPG